MASGRIPMGTVESDAIKAIGFSGHKGERGVLRVQLADGSTHDYPDIPYATYRRFVMSSSHGEFYNDRIRGRFK
jgi:hypothetical protein